MRTDAEKDDGELLTTFRLYVDDDDDNNDVTGTPKQNSNNTGVLVINAERPISWL